MGLIRAALKSAGGVFADQWKEYFYCDALNADTLVVKGQKRMGRRSANRKGSDNIITNGSVIAVADGQCMILVDQGRVAEVCAEPGEFIYDSSTEPTVFCGDLAQGLADTFEMIGKRFTFGGEPPKDQRVYYVNIKEITGNKYGTANPVPFRVVDQNIGLDLDIAIRCFGEYSYRISDPILFYTNVCGNVADAYTRMELDSQLKSELQTALQPAFARISGMGIRYSALPGHTMELADALNEVLSSKWRELRGLEIVSFGVSSVKASEEDEAMMKELQRNATFRDPNMAAAQLVGRPGGSHAVGGVESERRSHDGFRRDESGRGGRRRQCRRPLCHGGEAGASGSAPPGGYLGLQLRSHSQRKLLWGMRQKAAGTAAGRLDLSFLRDCEPGEVLPGVRSQKTVRRASVPVRQVRLAAGGSHASAQILSGMRRSL